MPPAAAGMDVLQGPAAGEQAAAYAGRRVLAFAGIGRPQKFFAMLEAGGIEVVRRLRFPDHPSLTAAELQHLAELADRLGVTAVTTPRISPAYLLSAARRSSRSASTWPGRMKGGLRLCFANAWPCQGGACERGDAAGKLGRGSASGAAEPAVAGGRFEPGRRDCGRGRPAAAGLPRGRRQSALCHAGARRSGTAGRGARSWSELGRTAGELPHLGRLPRGAGRRPGWTVEGEEHLATLAHGGGPAIFVTGHIGNWEVLPLASIACGVPVASFYRAAKNEGVDAIVAKFRQRAAGPDVKLFRKGAQGARQAMLHLRQGGFLGMLVDQKLNDGVEARLFGRPAMTAPAAAAFALHFRCPVIPILCRRIGPARLHVVVEPPVDVPLTGERAADILAVTQRINDRLETWIRDDPGSWLWMHRRWPKQLAPE